MGVVPIGKNSAPPGPRFCAAPARGFGCPPPASTRRRRFFKNTDTKFQKQNRLIVKWHKRRWLFAGLISPRSFGNLEGSGISFLPNVASVLLISYAFPQGYWSANLIALGVLCELCSSSFALRSDYCAKANPNSANPVKVIQTRAGRVLSAERAAPTCTRRRIHF